MSELKDNACIDVKGELLIVRGNYWEKQFCPHQASKRCGQWCPLFRETGKKNLGYDIIELCNHSLLYVTKDERK